MSRHLPRNPARAARARPPLTTRPAGLALLELLLVVALLAIVAAGALRLAGDRQEAVLADLTLVELARLRAALHAFQADTGHLPRQGPFALTTDPVPGLVAEPASGAPWFHHPFNVSQLLEQPVDGSGAPALPFSIDTGRGWRGPYLRHGTEGLVTAGAGLLPSGAGDPTKGVLVEDLPAVADPFDHHAPVGAHLSWKQPLTGKPLRRGRPIALLELDDPARARLVSFGPDGVYEAGGGDDLVLFLR